MSDKSRRKLLKSIAAGSGAIVAGKSLPESWSKPVVDSVMLPAHAQTSQICTIDITWEITVNGGSLLTGGYGYSIDYYPGGGYAVPPLSVNFTSSVNRTESIALPPGQYIVSAGANATIADVSGVTANGRTLLSCCSASTQLDQSWSVDQGNQSSGGGDAALVTIGADGTCQIDPAPPTGSDIRLKTNIEALSITREGYNLYKFQYIDENNENTYVGVMAQDIISRNPEAIVQNESGFYMVRYAQLGLKMVTLKQWESEGPDSVELIH